MATRRADQEEVVAAIRRHLETVGSKEWRLVQAQYPDVPEPTFWRWVRQAQARPNAEERAAARSLLRSLPAEVQVLGAAPVAGGQAMDTDARPHAPPLNFFGEIQQLMRDLHLLRGYALQADGSVKDARVLGDSIRLRGQVLQMYVAALPQVFNATRISRLHRLVVDAVGAIEPEAARAIVLKMRELGEAAGELEPGAG